MINIGRILKNERIKMFKTQQQVADALKISRPHYCDIECNRQKPSFDLLLRLAVFFDIDLNFLKKEYTND